MPLQDKGHTLVMKTAKLPTLVLIFYICASSHPCHWDTSVDLPSASYRRGVENVTGHSATKSGKSGLYLFHKPALIPGRRAPQKKGASGELLSWMQGGCWPSHPAEIQHIKIRDWKRGDGGKQPGRHLYLCVCSSWSRNYGDVFLQVKNVIWL